MLEHTLGRIYIIENSINIEFMLPTKTVKDILSAIQTVGM